MNSETLRAEEFETTLETIHDWPVRVVCYRIGERYFASIESVDAGAQIARSQSDSRTEALRIVREKASARLSDTRPQ